MVLSEVAFFPLCVTVDGKRMAWTVIGYDV